MHVDEFPARRLFRCKYMLCAVVSFLDDFPDPVDVKLLFLPAKIGSSATRINNVKSNMLFLINLHKNVKLTRRSHRLFRDCFAING